MTQKQLYVYLASYDTLAQAEADWKIVHSLERENTIQVADAAVITRDSDKKVSVTKDLHHPVRKGVVIGGVLALATPVGLLAGVLGGVVAGKITEHFHDGYDDGDLKLLARSLETGEVAIVVLTEFDQQALLDEKLTGAKDAVQENIGVDDARLAAVFRETHSAGGFTEK